MSEANKTQFTYITYEDGNLMSDENGRLWATNMDSKFLFVTLS